MNNSPELLSYVKISLSQGESREQIEVALKGGGWTIEEIGQAFDQVSAGTVTKLILPVPKRPRDSKGQIVTTIAILGTLLVGLGVILFIASNWQQIGPWPKVLMVFAALFGTYFASDYLQYKKDRPRLARALAFLGTLLMGGAIVLIAQIFNIVAENNNTLLYWALLILPIVYGLELKMGLALATVLVFIWQFAKSAGGIDIFNFFDSSAHTVNYWYPLLLGGIMVPLAYRLRATKVQPLNAIGLWLWLILASYFWAENSIRPGDGNYNYDHGIPGLLVITTMLYGVAIFCLGRLHQMYEKWKGMEAGYTILGFFMVFFPSFLLSFAELGDEILDSNVPPVSAIGWQSATALAVLVVSALVSMWLYRVTESTKRLYLGGNAAVGAVLALVFAILFFPTTFYVVLFNVLVFIESLGLMWYGYESRDKGYINLGLAFFLLMILVKYFQWGYDLFDRSLFFIGGGLVLIGLSYYGEKQRRRLIQQINQPHA